MLATLWYLNNIYFQLQSILFDNITDEYAINYICECLEEEKTTSTQFYYGVTSIQCGWIK